MTTPVGNDRIPRRPGLSPVTGARAPLRARLRWSAYVAATAPRQGRFPYRSPAAIERVQARRVQAAISHAYRHVPGYREAIDRLGMRPEDFRAATDLARLPLLERADVQGDPLRYTSRAAPLSTYTKLGTSGTSGAPLHVYHDRSSLAQTAGHRRRLERVVRSLAGAPLRYRLLVIRPEGSSAQAARRDFHRATLLPGWLRGVTYRRISLHEPFENVIDAVNEFRPHVIHSVGSYVEALFIHLHRNEIRMHLPRVLNYTSDQLSDHARRLINEEFGIPVVGVYGSVEAPAAAFECERHRGYHLNVDYCPVRIVDPGGRELPPGERGEVVLSYLANRGTMLLNYRQGDLASLIPEPCDCGRSLPLLSRVEAKLGEWVQDVAGDSVHPMAFNYVFKEESDSIWRWRMEQRRPGELLVSIVHKGDRDRDSLAGHLERKLSEPLGPGGRVSIRFVDDLPRTAAGKTPYFVSSSAARFEGLR